MQIVGLSCAACGKPIVAEPLAEHCPRCSLPFHKDCAPASACPKCSVPFDRSRHEQEERRADLLDVDALAGRSLLYGCFASLVVPILLGAAVALASGEDRTLAIAGWTFQVAWIALGLAFLYRDPRPARMIAIGGLAISTAVAAKLLVTATSTGATPFVLSMLILALCADGCILAVLALSRRVRLFVRAQAGRIPRG